MIESIKIGKLIKLVSTTGLIHKIGTDTYVNSINMLPTDTIDMYEEVDEKPAYTKEQYEAKVAELVREKYTESEEFAIQRKAINIAFSPATVSEDGNSALNEYQEYNAYVEDCKLRAKDVDLYKTPEQLEAARKEQLENECEAEDVENAPEEDHDPEA